MFPVKIEEDAAFSEEQVISVTQTEFRSGNHYRVQLWCFNRDILVQRILVWKELNLSMIVTLRQIFGTDRPLGVFQ